MMKIRTKTGHRGFSIVEMMIAIVIGLLVLAGLTTVLVDNSRTRTEIERSNRQIENGRYALQLLSDDLKLAGYFAEFDPNPITLPGTLPDPCSVNVADLQNAFMLHVQGYDNASTIPSCVSDVKAGTDILVIRRASTCSVGDTDCDPAAANVPYFQASLCSPGASGQELSFPLPDQTTSSYLGRYYQLSTNYPAAFTLHTSNCMNLAGVHRYLTHIYFIANNNNPGDGIPTLKRAELTGGTSGPVFKIVPLVDGIENLQIQYGIDCAVCFPWPPALDGIPDTYKAAPASVYEWKAAISARINLLARNTESTLAYTDNKQYTLGYDASGNLITYGPTHDQYKRHAYQSEVRLNNPAGRNTP